MIAKADIVVENFRPGVMTKLGLAPENLVKRFPKLIVASISGFGQYGLMSKQAAYDTIVQALSGIMGYGAIVTALAARERTGRGTTVDVAMLDSTFSLMAKDLMTALGPHKVPHRIGNRHPYMYMYPFDTFKCKDQPLAICCGNDHLWGLLSHALGHDEWVEDNRFDTNDHWEENWKATKAVIESVTTTDNVEAWR